MAHPKRKTSKTRRDKRRTHLGAEATTLNTCPTTGKQHRPHRAVWDGNKLYHKGELVFEKEEKKTSK